LLVSSPHEQGRAMQIFFTATRVVCNNTLTIALRTAKIAKDSADRAGVEVEGQFRMAHRRQFNEAMMERAKTQLGIAREQADDMRKACERLSRAKVSKDEATRMLAEVLHSDLKDEPMDVIRKDGNKQLSYAVAALDHSPGHDLSSANGTLWGVVNAVSYMTDHMIGRGADQRLDKAWFGKNAALKRKVFDAALAKA
jgi:hypothetical protein